jgi:hypothetical protein
LLIVSERDGKMSSWVDVCADCEEDILEIDAFIGELQDLMRKYNVGMSVEDCGMQVDHPVVTFTCYVHDVDDLIKEGNDAEDLFDSEWSIEMIDLYSSEAVKLKSP